MSPLQRAFNARAPIMISRNDRNGIATGDSAGTSGGAQWSFGRDAAEDENNQGQANGHVTSPI